MLGKGGAASAAKTDSEALPGDWFCSSQRDAMLEFPVEISRIAISRHLVTDANSWRLQDKPGEP